MNRVFHRMHRFTQRRNHRIKRGLHRGDTTKLPHVMTKTRYHRVIRIIKIDNGALYRLMRRLRVGKTLQTRRNLLRLSHPNPRTAKLLYLIIQKIKAFRTLLKTRRQRIPLTLQRMIRTIHLRKRGNLLLKTRIPIQNRQMTARIQKTHMLVLAGNVDHRPHQIPKGR